MIAVLEWSLHHWFLFFILSVFGVFEGIRDFFVDMAHAIAGGSSKKHKQRMKELKLQAKLAAANGGGKAVAVKPGPCVHRNVAPVVSVDEETVGWLCRSCDTRLPADWAVREEDL